MKYGPEMAVVCAGFSLPVIPDIFQSFDVLVNRHIISLLADESP